MGKYFGTDGFRGRFGADLTVEHAIKIGQFLGFYYGSKDVQGIVIGMDTRESGPFLKTALSMGINQYGMDVYDLDVIPTPGVAYLCRTYNMPGVVISASHNPYWDNGIKLLNEHGEKMEESVIVAIEAAMDAEGFFESEKARGGIIPFTYGRKEYVNYLASKAFDYTGLKVALDLSNGAASEIAKEVFSLLKANITIINNTPDGKNINNGCGSTHMEAIAQLVKDRKYDAGFAYDGDADRCLFTDEEGNILSGDHTLYLYGKYLAEKKELKNNCVVATIMSNFGLFKILDTLNIGYAKTKVGDKYVYEYMKDNDCSIGGEQSGHIIFMDDATTGDGILTSIKILNVMAEKKQKLSTLVEDFVVYPQVLKNLTVTDKKACQEDKDVLAIVAKMERELGDLGRVLVRASGTEPKIRVMAEATTLDACQYAVDSIIEIIEFKGYKI